MWSGWLQVICHDITRAPGDVHDATETGGPPRSRDDMIAGARVAAVCITSDGRKCLRTCRRKGKSFPFYGQGSQQVAGSGGDEMRYPEEDCVLHKE